MCMSQEKKNKGWFGHLCHDIYTLKIICLWPISIFITNTRENVELYRVMTVEIVVYGPLLLLHWALE